MIICVLLLIPLFQRFSHRFLKKIQYTTQLLLDYSYYIEKKLMNNALIYLSTMKSDIFVHSPSIVCISSTSFSYNLTASSVIYRIHSSEYINTEKTVDENHSLQSLLFSYLLFSLCNSSFTRYLLTP
ncbi:hypothetical protein CW304_26400 [Bacillus sp. UFRGS-B20]|nr:hypothetical protein CW304_26400 [Bacillus sp. UFRGS-B20]